MNRVQQSCSRIPNNWFMSFTVIQVVECSVGYIVQQSQTRIPNSRLLLNV